MMQMIQYTDYKSLCQFSFEHGSFYKGSEVTDTIPASVPIFVHMDHIYHFFKRIEGMNREFTVVSAGSDYGLTYQSQESVWFDMQKWISNFVSIDHKAEYSPVIIPPRCDVKYCKIDDKYSIKMHSWTGFTFEHIPNNVKHWYSTNINIDHPRITRIPFGIPDWTFSKIQARRQKSEHLKQKRTINIFYACSPNNVERVNLYNALKRIQSGPISEQANIYIGENMSHDDYVAALFNSKYVLCPEGNGYDCFRVLEALYAGAIPVLRGAAWNQVYNQLPCVIISDWGQILSALPEFQPSPLDNTAADLVQWRQRIITKT